MTFIAVHNDLEVCRQWAEVLAETLPDVAIRSFTRLEDAASASISSPAGCLVGLTEDVSVEALRAFRERSPLTPIAAVVDDDRRQQAVDWVQKNLCDRVVSQSSFDDSLREHVEAMVNYHRQLLRLCNALRGRIGKHLFVTGVTGFLGGRMVQELLRCSDCKITALSAGRRGSPTISVSPISSAPRATGSNTSKATSWTITWACPLRRSSA